MAYKHKFLSRLAALLLAAAVLPGAGALAAQPEEEAAPSAAIYTTSDMLGKVYAQDPVTGLKEDASYVKVAAAMAQEETPEESRLLLDGGDAAYTGLTGDDGQGVAQALRLIGYDALVPGVEEFRLGAGYCARFLQTLEQADGEGTPVDVLSANFLEDENEAPVASPYQVYTLSLDGSDIRVGVLGLGGIDTPQQLPQRLYGDHLFAHSANKENSYIWEWNYWQPQLEREQCDLVVVVCHADQDTLAQFAAGTAGIDLLVGGDGPADTGTFTNADGAAVTYVRGGGTALTRTTVTLDGDGNPRLGGSTLLELSDYKADTALAQAVSGSFTAAERAARQQVGTLSGTWDEEHSATLQNDTGDLVGEALLWATGADAALVSPGALGQISASSLFEKKSSTAVLTLGDCARLAPDPSPVVTVELTGAQLLQWLEVCSSRYTVTDAGQPMGGQQADFLYGMDYALYLGSAEGNRIRALIFQGKAVTDDQVFTVAVPAARLSDPEFPRCTVTWSAGADQDYASQGGSTAALLCAYAQDAAHQSRTLTPTRSSTWAVYGGAYNAPLTRLEFVEMLYDLAGRPQPGANYAFIDVNGSNAVIWAAEAGVVTGDGKGRFLPLTQVTREQAAVMIYNYVRRQGLALPPSSGAVDRLLDAPGISSWARPAVEFCLTAHIVPTAGTREDLYLPGDTITRGEASFYLANLKDYLEQ